MVEPRIVPRSEHAISRRDIDPDALKVLYRLRQFDHLAYLVGGSVRDLLLGRRPKDFDIGTSAHPSQIKKLFRNCWIIGRRFRLVHVKFRQKVIEVATFRRQVAPGEEVVQDGVPAPFQDRLIHRDNTFGTPEEDAFRRDFTINALFYDIATFSIIDYVGGLDDIRAGVVRSIGDPETRFVEDPVRMMRAVALAARLNFAIDPPVLDAIRIHRHELAKSSAPRLLEECYKILRAGSSEKTFRGLATTGLLEPVSLELHHGATEALWRSLRELDTYRRRFESAPDALTNPILLGALLVPLGASLATPRREDATPESAPVQPEGTTLQFEDRAAAATVESERRRASAPRLGELPLARRDIERLRQIIGLQRRLRVFDASPRAQRALFHRGIFREAMTWLEIHGGAPETVERWRRLAVEFPDGPDGAAEPGLDSADVTDPAHPPNRRRRRHQRRRFLPLPKRRRD